MEIEKGAQLMDVTDTTDLPPSSGAETGGDEGGEQNAPGKKSRKPKVTQAEPTQPRKVDPDTGLELDEYDLPLSGPARVKALKARGLDTDPALTTTENADG